MKRLRFLALVFSLALIILCMPAKTYAEDGFVDDPGREYGDAFYTLGEGGILFSCYEYGEDEAVVYMADAGIQGKVVIPPTIYDAGDEKDRTIVGIISPAEVDKEEYSTGLHHYEGYSFGGNYDITELTLPSTIKFIGQGALYQHDKLKKVVFNSDNASSADYTVETYAFGQCTALTEISFGPDDNAIVKGNAFSDCTALKTITFPEAGDISTKALEGCFNLEEVINAPYGLYLYHNYSDFFEENCPKNSEDEYVFNLRKIVFPEGYEEITGIEQSDMHYQKVSTPYLKDVTLPSTAEYIEGFAYTAIESIDLPEGLIEISGRCFDGCTALRSADLPDSLRIIGGYAFNGCSQLTGSATLPNLEEVGDHAFAGCHDLKLSVKINGMIYGPEFYDSGVTDVTFTATDDENDWVCYENRLFLKCPDLKSITVLGDHTYFKSVDGVLYASFPNGEDEGTERVWALLKYPPAKSGGDYTIPSDVTYIAAYAFDGCRFNSIHIPVTVKGFRNNLQYYDEEGHNHGYPFCSMANNAPVYYVKNSYVDKRYAADFYEKDYDITFKNYSNLKTEAGPDISISYDLDGGENAAGNPTSMIAGGSVTLSDPKKAGYEFAGWEHQYTNKEGYPVERSIVKDGILTPVNDELVKGVKLRAKWRKAGEDQDQDKPVTPTAPSGPVVGKV
ncbi:MAG: leucine-rich repeat protein, partial [Firmicutes bacterium]|nr:leucine-rich repeat protein [Bacillota bacterium]